MKKKKRISLHLMKANGGIRRYYTNKEHRNN